jgi:hypothetical protein
MMIYASDDASVTGNGVENTWEIQNYLSCHWPSRFLFCVDGRDLSFGFDTMPENTNSKRISMEVTDAGRR